MLTIRVLRGLSRLDSEGRGYGFEAALWRMTGASEGGAKALFAFGQDFAHPEDVGEAVVVLITEAGQAQTVGLLKVDEGRSSSPETPSGWYALGAPSASTSSPDVKNRPLSRLHKQ